MVNGQASNYNRRLKDNYGIWENGLPNYRLVWSEDQYEKRIGEFDIVTESGIFLRKEVGVKEVPKYRYFREKWVLEKIFPINGPGLTEKWSYEPVYAFVQFPSWKAIQFLIHTIIANMSGNPNYPKYHEPNLSPEEERYRIEEIAKELFSNETSTGDALAHKQAIIVPRSYQS